MPSAWKLVHTAARVPHCPRAQAITVLRGSKAKPLGHVVHFPVCLSGLGLHCICSSPAGGFVSGMASTPTERSRNHPMCLSGLRTRQAD